MRALFRPLSPFQRLEELATRGACLLDPPARDEIHAFLLARQQPDGGFRGPAGTSDLYYTLFALGALRALEVEEAGAEPYLASFGHGAELDLVHLSSLAVCRGALSKPAPDRAWTQACLAQLERFRQPDGGFSVDEKESGGTPYGGYLALLAAGALGVRLPQRRKAIAASERCRATDGGYAGHPDATQGTLPGTVAALVLRASSWRLPPKQTTSWFQSCQRDGGFAAVTDLPIPDLLSTATALAANRLLRMGLSIDKTKTAAFVESCWDESGGFGAIPDTTPDCEYTFYALLALGALA
ncbi:MAG: hypothetical protein HN380_17410 [Victivallales bacterium]|jgi:prenyltransferase beta subunit|nr:hypothetical protein [Victivallales bacterium]